MVAYGVDVPPTGKRMARPRYPGLAESMGVSGRVGVEFVIDTAGVPEPGSITVTDANYSDFAEAAVKAIRESRFHPGTVQGCPVRVVVRTAVVFKSGRDDE
jgi:protein TonB